MVKRLTIFLAIITTLLCPFTPVSARSPFDQNHGVEVDILVDGVVQKQTTNYRGERCLPVRKMGVEYTIRIRNPGTRRIEAVLAVDGLSVINGKPARDGIRGYLVEAGCSIEIPGWRRGDNKVAAFEFTTYEESYAYRVGRPGGIGTIQLTAYAEKQPVDRPSVSKSSQPESSLYSERLRKSAVPDKRVGTGYGRELDHEVTYVPFERSLMKQTLTIRYGRAANPRPVPKPRIQPDNFTPPPPGYRGSY